jgi:tetratricopeptide (TPR) repeat protein
LAQSQVVPLHRLLRSAIFGDGGGGALAEQALSACVVEHVGGPSETFVVRRAGQPVSTSVLVPSPYTWSVPGRSDGSLMTELRWYLEHFLDYPFPPETERAARVLAALESWGLAAFTALFLAGGPIMDDATGGGGIEVQSDDPGVLSWPWEALRGPSGAPLATRWPTSRRAGASGRRPGDGLAQPLALPTDRINILLVIPRPFGAADLGYRSIARSVVDLAATLPVQVDVLRPPTLARLREQLDRSQARYHVVHFDGHGTYAGGSGAEGQLIFEKNDGTADPVSAGQLQELFTSHLVSGVVLNACQSAMIGPEAESAFASIAAALLASGVPSVVAMSYTLYASGAHELVPAFYRRLLESGRFGEAVRWGRDCMRAQPGRVCSRGRFELEDWIIPVLYQDAPVEVPLVAPRARPVRDSHLPPDLRPDTEHGRPPLGRDGPILALERALHLPPPAILVTGLGGIGKTTVVRQLLQWLDTTDGLEREPFWFDMRQIKSAAYIFDRIGERILGAGFGAATLEQRVARLAAALHDNRFLIVWDNFESASGLEGTGSGSNLDGQGLAELAGFLRTLTGGRTKVLITSRSEEPWLEKGNRTRLPLTGLDGEERWQYCEQLLSDAGLTLDRAHPELQHLMDLLNGHPLAMQVIMLQLGDRTPGEITAALRTNLAALKLDGGGDQEAQLLSAVRMLDAVIPNTLRPLLIAVSLHEANISLVDLRTIAARVSEVWTKAEVDRLAGILVGAGLLRRTRGDQLEMHPTLTGYLRSTVPHDDAWSRAFVEVMKAIAADLVDRLARQERRPFAPYLLTFRSALEEARRLGMEVEDAALTDAVGLSALEQGELDEAELQFEHLRQYPDGQGIACQHLGMVAHAKRHLDVAVRWLRQSLEPERRLGAFYAAASYHELGVIAEERRNFGDAEDWYRRSLQIKEKLVGDQRLRIATAYHQLGRLAEKARRFDVARDWYTKARDLRIELGDDEAGVAVEIFQLGVIESRLGNVSEAKTLFRSVLATNERLGPPKAKAYTCHELGILADGAGHFDEAEEWYLRSLAIKEKIGDLVGAANTYSHLGLTRKNRGDLDGARAWLEKSHGVCLQLGDPHAVAVSEMNLGALANAAKDFVVSGEWSVQALKVVRYCDQHLARLTAENFELAYDRAGTGDRSRLRQMWERARLGPFPYERRRS